MAVTKKTATTKKAAAPRKPRAVKAAPEHDAAADAGEIKAVAPVEKVEVVQAAEMSLAEGRYSFATGRRKTSVANVKLFSGKGKSTINKIDMLTYLGNQALVDEAMKPLQLTGLESRVFIWVNLRGGGKHSQAGAVAQGIATALSKHNPEFRKVLKKNGTLTRDSRMKERKKPGLKRARRGSQWAKR